MNTDQLMVLGKVTSVYGVKGWVKVYSDTEPLQNILDYKPWYMKLNGRLQEIEVEQGKTHGKGLVAKLADCNDRDKAREYCGAEIYVNRGLLPALEQGEYYWHQLVGCEVWGRDGSEVGTVREIWETGAHDVLVVESREGERYLLSTARELMPEVDVESRRITVELLPGMLEPVPGTGSGTGSEDTGTGRTGAAPSSERK